MTGDYDRGYKKPPKENQFKPGQSGNPRGRPRERRSTNMAQGLTDALSASVTLHKGGRTRRITTSEALFYRLGQQALKGDAAAYDMLLQEAVRCGLLKAVQHPDPDAPQGGILLVPDQLSTEEWIAKYGRNTIETVAEMEQRLGKPITTEMIRTRNERR